MGGGADIAGNVLAGLGLGWLAQHFFPGIQPWGLAAGIVLGAISGFYQVLKREGALEAYKPKKSGTDPNDKEKHG